MPPEYKSVRDYMFDVGPYAFVQELERLSAQGSDWATCALADISLSPDNSGVRNAQRAASLCRPLADVNYAYAQYILAWALLHLGHRKEAYEYMSAAAALQWPPAAIGLVWFSWIGVVKKLDRPQSILLLLYRADQSRHKAALSCRSLIYRTGRLGNWYRLLGYLSAPIGNVIYNFWRTIDPFSEKTYLFDYNHKAPFVRAV